MKRRGEDVDMPMWGCLGLCHCPCAPPDLYTSNYSVPFDRITIAFALQDPFSLSPGPCALSRGATVEQPKDPAAKPSVQDKFLSYACPAEDAKTSQPAKQVQ